MKKVFVTFGDANYRQSLQRIQKEAEQTGLFDEVRCYTPADLPLPFADYTKQYRRGCGYWMWKPWIIKDALNQAGPNAIVAYADAGCQVFQHRDWERYFQLLKRKKAVFFIAPGKNGRWCKRAVPAFFRLRQTPWRWAHQAQATFMLVRQNNIIDHWCHMAEQHPELFVDVAPEKIAQEAKNFREHRHDQAVLTACICASPMLKDVALLPEKVEHIYANGQAILAARMADASCRTTTKRPVGTWSAWIQRWVYDSLLASSTRCLFYFSRTQTISNP